MLAQLCPADHFKIYSKSGALPLVAFGLKKAKDPKTGKEVERPYTCFDVADKVRVRGELAKLLQL